MKSENSFIKDENECPVNNDSVTNSIAEAWINIGRNNMQIVEIKAYPLKDKIKKLRGTHSFKGYTLNEITVLTATCIKEGYLTINNGLEMPLHKLRIDSLENSGPWYFTNKDEAIQTVREFNKIEWDAIRETKAEVDAAEEYLRNLLENDRY